MVMVAGLLWGTTGILAKWTYANTTIGPISLAWLRILIALPMLGLLATTRHASFSLNRRELLLFLAFGFCSLTVFESLYFTSFAYTSVQHAAALLYTAPGFVAVLSWFVLKEKLTRRKIVAVVLSISGAFLIMGLLRGEHLFASRTQVGDWLALGSGLAYATWYIFGKVLGRNREAAVTSFFALLFGAVFFVPLVVALEATRLPQSLLAWELVAAVGIIPTTMAYMFYLTGLKLVDATKASVFAITEPIGAVSLAFLFFGETLSYDSLVGLALIISSILLISFSEKSNENR